MLDVQCSMFDVHSFFSFRPAVLWPAAALNPEPLNLEPIHHAL
jgi:hypothetical protein